MRSKSQRCRGERLNGLIQTPRVMVVTFRVRANAFVFAFCLPLYPHLVLLGKRGSEKANTPPVNPLTRTGNVTKRS